MSADTTQPAPATWLRRAQPTPLRGLSKDIPERRLHRLVRQVYLRAWQHVLDVVAEIQEPRHDDGGVGFHCPGGDWLWFCPAQEQRPPFIDNPWQPRGATDWHYETIEEGHDDVVACVEGIEIEALDRLAEEPAWAQLVSLLVEEDTGNPEIQSGSELRFYLHYKLEYAVYKRIDLRAVRSNIEAQFAFDPKVIGRWQRLRTQLQITREQIRIKEYNLLAAAGAMLDVIEAAEPRLLWLGWLFLGVRPSGCEAIRPFAWMRKVLTGYGLDRGFWRRLLEIEPASVGRIYRSYGTKTLEELVSHGRLEHWLGHTLPLDGVATEWVKRFERRTELSEPVTFYHLDIDPGVAQIIAYEGARLLLAGANEVEAFSCFEEHHLPVVLNWIQHASPKVDRHQHRAGWRNLLRRARAWQAEQDALKDCGDLNWPIILTDPFEFESHRITPITDGYHLWREGVLMHHCIGTYADQCARGRLHIFHADLPGTVRGYTLALRHGGDDVWHLQEIRGVANAYPTETDKAWAERLCAYLTIEQQADHYETEEEEDEDIEDDDDEEEDDDDDYDAESACPICDREHCYDHLLASITHGESIPGGEIYNHWLKAMRTAEDLLRQAYLEQRQRTGAGSELDSLLHELQRQGQPCTEAGFDEASSEVGVSREISAYVAESLWSLDGVEDRDFERDGMPGMSESGCNYYAEDPKAASWQWFEGVMASLGCVKDAVGCNADSARAHLSSSNVGVRTFDS